MVKEAALRPKLTDMLFTLPSDTLSLLAISSYDLSKAYELGYIPTNMQWKKSILNRPVPFTKEHSVHSALIDIMGYASTQAHRDNSTPIIAVMINTNNAIEMGRIVNVLNTEDLGIELAAQQISQLIEDNFGRIKMLIKRFGEPQQHQTA